MKIHDWSFYKWLRRLEEKGAFKEKKITGEGIQIFTLKNPVAELCIGIS